MSRDGGTRRFSLPRVNPCLGTLQVVELEGARAISPDGQQWEIQVAAERPANLWGSPSRGHRLTDFFTFGIWSAHTGLRRVPVNPLFDIGTMLEESGRMLAALERCAMDLPFPPAPVLELWLLDQAERRPLALLAVARDHTSRDRLRPGTWAAARRGDNGFRSRSLTERGIPGEEPGSPRRHLEAVENLVSRAAGSARLAQWLHREADGGGTALSEAVPAEPGTRILRADAFPELLLREDWTGEEDARLVADYLAWQAPRLLCLPGLADGTRARLERAARAQPLLVDRRWRLYPKRIDHDLIEQARVEARLRRSNP